MRNQGFCRKIRIFSQKFCIIWAEITPRSRLLTQTNCDRDLGHIIMYIWRPNIKIFIVYRAGFLEHKIQVKNHENWKKGQTRILDWKMDKPCRRTNEDLGLKNGQALYKVKTSRSLEKRTNKGIWIEKNGKKGLWLKNKGFWEKGQINAFWPKKGQKKNFERAQINDFGVKNFGLKKDK